MRFQFTLPNKKKKPPQKISYFHIYYSPELFEMFKLYFKKSDGLKRCQMTFKVENMRKSGIIKNFMFFKYIFLTIKYFFSLSAVKEAHWKAKSIDVYFDRF